MQIVIVLLSQVSNLTYQYKRFIVPFKPSCLETNYAFYRTSPSLLAPSICKTIKVKWRELIGLHLEFLSIIKERKKSVLPKHGNCCD